MSSIQQQYREKRREAAEAVREIRDGDAVIVPTGVGEPPALLTALSDQRKAFHGVRLMQILPCGKYGYFDPATAEHVRHVAYFFGAADGGSMPTSRASVQMMSTLSPTLTCDSAFLSCTLVL